jgi:tetratricopeptide (TPR) repeat protein
VFWVDASSDEIAKHSLRAIANVAEKDPPTEIAARNWLSNTRNPWLLIIDNADKLEEPIESYFPQGERGCILITTRNFELAQQGTCGNRYYHFSSLKEDEANELFLRAAEKPSPWTIVINQLAAAITRALGFLPLALVQAGKAILGGIKIEEFLSSYEKHWDRLRNARSKGKKKPKDDTYTVIYSTYETLYQRLEERRSSEQVADDAIYVLKLFSFLHRENIRMDILTQAVNNPYLQKCSDESQKKAARSAKRLTRPKSWTETIRDLLIEVIGLLRRGERPILPDLLAWNDFPEAFDDSRLRAALKELQKMSLVTHDREHDSYSMHPVVHSWVRKRPEMSLTEQAVFCHASATILSNAILLPPLGLREKDADFRRAIMPHIDHVRRCQTHIREGHLHNRRKRPRRTFSCVEPQLDRPLCLQLAKFSYVYVQCGRFQGASELQRRVFNFLNETFGMEHESTLRIAPLLAGVLRHLDKMDEAAELQKKVMNACIALWGEEDAQALEAASALGMTRFQQGHFTEARSLQQLAVDGYTKIRGSKHPDTLNAISKLASIHTKILAFAEAIKLHNQAVSGLLEQRGAGHEDTMLATNELGMTYLERVIHRQGQPDDLDEAFRVMQEVVMQRKEKSGKEHGYTLWAIANLARVKNALGKHDEAEADFRAGLPIVEQNFGEGHLGTLYGKTYFSHVLISQRKFDEAEEILVGVIDSHQRVRPNHPDQFVAFSFLLKLYDLSGRQEDAAKVRDRIQEGLDALGTRGRAWDREKWEMQLFDAWIPQEDAQTAS